MAEQLFGALLAQNGARIDLRGDLEGAAGREVGLDRAGDDIDRRALRGHDDMDAGGAGHLGKALDGTSISLPATIIRSAISSTTITSMGIGS
jgi:hypothetical protein